MAGRMVAFVLAVTVGFAAVGYVTGALMLDSGPVVAAASGVLGLLLGAALWSTRRRDSLPPARDAERPVGPGRSRRAGRVAGKER